MFCPNCGNEVPDEAKYCGQCGSLLRESHQLQLKEKEPRRRIKRRWIVLSFAIILFAVISVMFISATFFGDNASNDSLEGSVLEENDSTLILTGRVIDSESKETIPEALVTAISDEELSQECATETDSEGAFRLHIPVGEITIIIQKEGYDTYEWVPTGDITGDLYDVSVCEMHKSGDGNDGSDITDGKWVMVRQTSYNNGLKVHECFYNINGLEEKSVIYDDGEFSSELILKYDAYNRPTDEIHKNGDEGEASHTSYQYDDANDVTADMYDKDGNFLGEVELIYDDNLNIISKNTYINGQLDMGLRCGYNEDGKLIQQEFKSLCSKDLTNEKDATDYRVQNTFLSYDDLGRLVNRRDETIEPFEPDQNETSVTKYEYSDDTTTPASAWVIYDDGRKVLHSYTYDSNDNLIKDEYFEDTVDSQVMICYEYSFR